MPLSKTTSKPSPATGFLLAWTILGLSLLPLSAATGQSSSSADGYTIVMNRTSFDSTGTPRDWETEVLAVRHDGSRARHLYRSVLDSEGLASGHVAIVTDAVAGKRVTFFPELSAKVTVPISVKRQHPARKLDPKTCLRVAEKTGLQAKVLEVGSTVLGYETVHVQLSLKVPRSSKVLVREEWRAPALGCAALRERRYEVDKKKQAGDDWWAWLKP